MALESWILNASLFFLEKREKKLTLTLPGCPVCPGIPSRVVIEVMLVASVVGEECGVAVRVCLDLSEVCRKERSSPRRQGIRHEERDTAVRGEVASESVRLTTAQPRHQSALGCCRKERSRVSHELPEWIARRDARRPSHARTLTDEGLHRQLGSEALREEAIGWRVGFVFHVFQDVIIPALEGRKEEVRECLVLLMSLQFPSHDATPAACGCCNRTDARVTTEERRQKSRQSVSQE